MDNFVKEFKEMLEKYDAIIIPIVSHDEDVYEIAIKIKSSDGSYEYIHFTDIQTVSASDCERLLK